MLSIGDLVALLEMARDSFNAANQPSFIQAKYGGIPPEAIALPKGSNNLDIGGILSDRDALSYLDSVPNHAWCHELRLRTRIRNPSTRVLRILGISPNKKELSTEYRSAIMFPSQGSTTGDVVRFECDLDSGRPSMRRFELNEPQKIYTSSEYYFDEGMLEIDPDHTACLSILFYAESATYELSPESG